MDLQPLFDEYRVRYFGSRLPQYRVILAPPPWHPYEGGYCYSEIRTIYVNSDTPDVETRRQVLLHEMCHIGGPPGHGHRFQARLRHLAASGEVWAADEAVRYRAACRLLAKRIAEVAAEKERQDIAKYLEGEQ